MNDSYGLLRLILKLVAVFDIEIRRTGESPKILLDSKETEIIPITSEKHKIEAILS